MKKISESGYQFIKKLEGFSPKAYLCPAGVLTIGYGHTRNVIPGMTIIESYADKLLREDCTPIIKTLNELNIELTQYQFDALASFIFNVGIKAFENSTLRTKLLRGDEDSYKELARWKYSKGKIILGLKNRRLKEQNLFLYGDYGL